MLMLSNFIFVIIILKIKNLMLVTFCNGFVHLNVVMNIHYLHWVLKILIQVCCVMEMIDQNLKFLNLFHSQSREKITTLSKCIQSIMELIKNFKYMLAKTIWYRKVSLFITMYLISKFMSIMSVQMTSV